MAAQRRKNFEDIFIRFDTTHERDRHTDRQTPHYSICIASRGKNSASVKESEKLLLHPHPDQYQNLITSRGSPFAHATVFGRRPLLRL